MTGFDYDTTVDQIADEIEKSPESAIALTDVSNHLPRHGGKNTNYSTVWRWATKGLRVKTSNGPVMVLLETTLIGKIRYTSKAALRRFNKARNYLAQRSRGAVLTIAKRPQSANRRFLEREGFSFTRKTKTA